MNKETHRIEYRVWKEIMKFLGVKTIITARKILSVMNCLPMTVKSLSSISRPIIGVLLSGISKNDEDYMAFVLFLYRFYIVRQVGLHQLLRLSDIETKKDKI